MDSLRGIRTRHDPYSGSRPIVHQLRPRARDPEMMELEDEGKYAAAMNYQEYVDSSMPLTDEALWKASIARGSGSNRRSTTSYATSRSSASIRTGRTSQSYDTDITAPSEYGGSDAGTLRSQRSSVDDIGISAARRFQRAPGVRQSVGDCFKGCGRSTTNHLPMGYSRDMISPGQRIPGTCIRRHKMMRTVSSSRPASRGLVEQMPNTKIQPRPRV